MAALNADDEIFVVYVAALTEPTTIPIDSSYYAEVATPMSEKNGIFAEYSNFFNIFSSDSTTELLKHTRINYHPINLLEDKQLFYSSIYILGQVDLEILKTYIEANLASGFIRPSKSPFGILILFV